MSNLFGIAMSDIVSIECGVVEEFTGMFAEIVFPGAKIGAVRAESIGFDDTEGVDDLDRCLRSGSRVGVGVGKEHAEKLIKLVVIWHGLFRKGYNSMGQGWSGGRLVGCGWDVGGIDWRRHGEAKEGERKKKNNRGK